jgi:hypothetical protein
MGFELLHSKAYMALDYAPAVKVLSWFHEKIRVEVLKGKHGKRRYRLLNDGELEFTYKEAGFRELTHQQFRKALEALHEVGFIDVKRPGSAIKGDHTIFGLSNRWRTYETDDYKKIEFPKSVRYVNFGFGRKGEEGKS